LIDIRTGRGARLSGRPRYRFGRTGTGVAEPPIEDDDMSDGRRSCGYRVVRWFCTGFALALSGLVVGCATMNEVAEKQFVGDHPGCATTVRQRPDLVYGSSATYEVTGCNNDVLYTCTPLHMEQNSDGSNSPVSASCSKMDWCTPDGCDSFELAARKTFERDKACPFERVSATEHAATIPTAPADVASDPKRMRIWVDTHEAQIAGHTFMTATGCDAETAYECMKPPIPRSIPICAPDPTRTAANAPDALSAPATAPRE
jgi:hypothetical protein